MRKPSLAFDAILAALAVLSTGAGCSKADRASAEPPAAAPAAAPAPAGSAAATPTATSMPTPTAANEPPVAPPMQAAGPAAVDAGVEKKSPPKIGGGKGGSAACGATGCSAEMRKGGK